MSVRIKENGPKKAKTNLMFSALIFVSLAQNVLALNCFYDGLFTYAYTIPDYSGNYTNGKEYWLAKS